MKKEFSKLKAFTLIELMIVISIIGIMSAVGIVSLISSRKTMALKASQDEVASAIKLAQSYALQGRVNGVPAVKPDGYGFEFLDQDTYRIFAFTGASTSVVETSDLKNGITLTSPAFASAEIRFKGDYADVIFLGGTIPLVMTLNASGTTKTVEVNRRGYITQK